MADKSVKKSIAMPESLWAWVEETAAQENDGNRSKFVASVIRSHRDSVAASLTGQDDHDILARLAQRYLSPAEAERLGRSLNQKPGETADAMRAFLLSIATETTPESMKVTEAVAPYGSQIRLAHDQLDQLAEIVARRVKNDPEHPPDASDLKSMPELPHNQAM